MQEINLLVEQENGTIGGNFEELKAALKTELEMYKGMIFTEDSKTEAKRTVANLRKLKKGVNDKKLEVKKNFMAPYTEFEAQVKELDKLIDEPINFINGQVEEFERRRVEERKKLIHEIYDEIILEHGTVNDYLPLQRIYDSRWENATMTRKAVREAITEHVEHVEKDIAVIHNMESEFEDKGLERYKETLELSDAIAIMNRYQKQKEEILRRQEEEKKKRMEEETCRAEEDGQEADAPVQEKSPEQISAEESFIEPELLINKVRYEVSADPFQIAQLEAAMREYDIEFRRI